MYFLARLINLRNSLHENPGLWGHSGPFGDRSGVVRGSFGGRSGVVRGRSGLIQGLFGGRSGVARDRSEAVWMSFGSRSGIVRIFFRNFLETFFENCKLLYVQTI